MTTLVVLQPGYLPWLGFFDQFDRADVFVHYDDVGFDKSGWRNRNRIKTGRGPLWLTVPVVTAGRSGQRILDVEIDNDQPWARKHARAVREAYARAPFAKPYLEELEALLGQTWDRLVDLDLAVIDAMCRWLGLTGTRVLRSSELGVSGERSGRLLALCRHVGADQYLSGTAAQAYLDINLFASHGIRVTWQNYHHPIYVQLHGAFVPYLSALDLILNLGPESLGIIRQGR